MTHQFRENGSHYNGGAVFFGYGYTAIGEPRLKMIRKWFRKERGRAQDEYFIDGAKVESYEAAIAALKLPVVFTDNEIIALASIGYEPADLRRKIGIGLLQSLSDKGAIECGPPGCCRRVKP